MKTRTFPPTLCYHVENFRIRHKGWRGRLCHDETSPCKHGCGCELLVFPSSSKKKKRKPPAPWARSSPLKRALKIQFGMKGPAPINPDQIFAERTSCDLEKIFDMKKKRYQRRGRSGVWLKDRVTDEEKQKYARRMGFAPLAYKMT